MASMPTSNAARDLVGPLAAALATGGPLPQAHVDSPPPPTRLRFLRPPPT